MIKQVMDQALLKRLLHRPAGSNKYDFGHVLIVGGSPGMVGAPLLAGEAALRIGAGLVTIAAAANVADKLERRVADIMTLSLPTAKSAAVAGLRRFIAERHVNAIVLGPGLGIRTAPLLRSLLLQLDQPIVVDAGGIAALSGHLELLDQASTHNPSLILTPHSGEYAKLIQATLPGDRSALKHQVAEFAKRHNVTLILKGQHTLVAHPGGEVYVNQTGGPGLAKAGTGDVLSGMVAGLLAQGIAPAQAAAAGVNLHGSAGDLATNNKTEAGVMASDLIELLPTVLKQLEM